MNDTNLEQLIAHSIRIVAAEEAVEKEKAEADEAAYQEELAKATKKALAEIDKRDAVPVELLPYIKGDGPGCWNMEEGVETIRKGWLPHQFRISAPGLAPIEFKVKSAWDRNAGKDIPGRVEATVTLHGVHGWETWDEAITKAARMYADQVKWEEQEAQRSAQVIAAMKEPRALTLDERFVALVREIVREEIADREE